MKVVIIGGTSGIGLALARYYLSQGHYVEVTGCDITRVPNSLKSSHGDKLSLAQFDVGSKNEIQHYFYTQQDQAINLFIYCAGQYFNKARYDLTKDEVEQMTGVNGSGFLHCFELAANKMKTQNTHAHLVAISSVAGVVKSANPTLYGQLKAQMISTADRYRKDLMADSISVTVIAPHYINTQKLRDLMGANDPKKPF